MYIIGGIPSELACDARSFDIDHGDGNITSICRVTRDASSSTDGEGKSVVCCRRAESRLEKA